MDTNKGALCSQRKFITVYMLNMLNAGIFVTTVCLCNIKLLVASLFLHQGNREHYTLILIYIYPYRPIYTLGDFTSFL